MSEREALPKQAFRVRPMFWAMLAGVLAAFVAVLINPWIIIKNERGLLFVLASPLIGWGVYAALRLGVWRITRRFPSSSEAPSPKS